MMSRVQGPAPQTQVTYRLGSQERVRELTIKNTHGTVLAHSKSTGKNTIVTCIVAKDALLAGVGGAGTGASSMTSQLMSGLR